MGRKIKERGVGVSLFLFVALWIFLFSNSAEIILYLLPQINNDIHRFNKQNV